MTLLYIDDVCAILITAIFYGGYLSAMSFMVIRPAALGTFIFKFGRHNIKACYVIFFGIILRMRVLKSGVNVTLAGIVAVFFVLLKANRARCYDRSSTTRTSRRLFRSVGIRPREC